MEYLMLWSGDMYGMRKVRVPARESSGIVGHWVAGKCYLPNLYAAIDLLPRRYRAMARRAGSFWIENGRNDGPATLHLRDTRGNLRHTLYFQPVTA